MVRLVGRGARWGIVLLGLLQIPPSIYSTRSSYVSDKEFAHSMIMYRPKGIWPVPTPHLLTRRAKTEDRTPKNAYRPPKRVCGEED